MSAENKVVDLQSVLRGDLYQEARPQIDGIKQVLDTLKDRVQPLTPEQVQAIGYLEYLQARPIHKGKKPYTAMMKHIEESAPKVAPPGFFIRVIEALIPRPTYVDGKTAVQQSKERDGN
jgi:hypothetical protein